MQEKETAASLVLSALNNIEGTPSGRFDLPGSGIEICNKITDMIETHIIDDSDTLRSFLEESWKEEWALHG